MSDTNKCPFCSGGAGENICDFECLECGEEISPAAMHRIRELEARVKAKDEALKKLASFGERLQDFDPPGPATAEQQREDQYGRNIESVARAALKK